MNVHFRNDVDLLTGRLRALANHILDQLRCAARATVTGDGTAAEAVCRKDVETDREEVLLEQECLRLIALYAPTETDLRYVFGITKVVHELERIGDLAKKVARRAGALAQLSLPSTARDLTLLSDLTLSAAAHVMDAFIAQDDDKARSVWEHDPAIDDIHDRLQARFNEALGKAGAPVEPLLAARALVSSLERIGDHATRIAKVTIYTRHGRIMRHQSTPDARPRVLFICQHNSSRSQMAEAWVKYLFGNRFAAESAGLEPGPLNPLTVEVMHEVGIDISRNPTRAVFDLVKSGELYAQVITLCDEAHAERCPVFAGVTRREQWNFPDPAAFTGDREDALARIRGVRDAIRIQVVEWAHRNA